MYAYNNVSPIVHFLRNFLKFADRRHPLIVPHSLKVLLLICKSPGGIHYERMIKHMRNIVHIYRHTVCPGRFTGAYLLLKLCVRFVSFPCLNQSNRPFIIIRGRQSVRLCDKLLSAPFLLFLFRTFRIYGFFLKNNIRFSFYFRFLRI